MSNVQLIFSADNVDVQKAALTGSGPYHGMGAILSHVPLSLSSQISCKTILRKTVSKTDILKNSITIKQFKEDCTIKNLELTKTFEFDATYFFPVEYMRIIYTMFNPHCPQISGCVHIITKHNKAPDKHTIDFLTLVDLASTDPHCMNTTLHYISELHKKLKLTGIHIVTFDQPLWKLAMIVKHQVSIHAVILLDNFTHN